MSKESLIKGKANRSKWPISAKSCEYIYNLSIKLKKYKILENYNKTTTSEIYKKLIQTEAFDAFLNINHVSELIKNNNNIVTELLDDHIIQSLNNLGIILADSLWYERYEQVASKMGTGCIISVRTAEALFTRDPKAKEIKERLSRVVSLAQKIKGGCYERTF